MPPLNRSSGYLSDHALFGQPGAVDGDGVEGVRLTVGGANVCRLPLLPAGTTAARARVEQPPVPRGRAGDQVGRTVAVPVRRHQAGVVSPSGADAEPLRATGIRRPRPAPQVQPEVAVVVELCEQVRAPVAV